MEQLMIYTNNTEETQELGKCLGSLAREDMIFLMKGIIGAGKTTMTQGIARGMGITRHVTSPTFTIQKIYHGTTMDLYHIDAYRLEGIQQDLGFEDDFDNDGDEVEEEEEVLLSDFGGERNALILKEEEGDETRSYSSLRLARSSSEVMETKPFTTFP